jgi:hypothetical protein
MTSPHLLRSDFAVGAMLKTVETWCSHYAEAGEFANWHSSTDLCARISRSHLARIAAFSPKYCTDRGSIFAIFYRESVKNRFS